MYNLNLYSFKCHLYLNKTGKKELIKFKSKNMNNSIKKWAKGLKKHLAKEDIQMSNKHKEKCSTSYVIREMQTEIMKCHYMTIGIVKIQNNKCW